MKCSGVQVSGYWKGYSCGAVPVAKFKGKSYCATHRTIAEIAPGRFEKALASYARALRRRDIAIEKTRIERERVATDGQ